MGLTGLSLVRIVPAHTHRALLTTATATCLVTTDWLLDLHAVMCCAPDVLCTRPGAALPVHETRCRPRGRCLRRQRRRADSVDRPARCCAAVRLDALSPADPRSGPKSHDPNAASAFPPSAFEHCLCSPLSGWPPHRTALSPAAAARCLLGLLSRLRPQWPFTPVRRRCAAHCPVVFFLRLWCSCRCRRRNAPLPIRALQPIRIRGIIRGIRGCVRSSVLMSVRSCVPPRC